MEANNLLSDRPLLIYLATKMEEDFLIRFYENSTCVISTYRMLPVVAQKCFINLLYQPSKTWKSWSKQRHTKNVYQSLRLLMQLKIVEGDIDGQLQLNEDFRMHYISSLLSSTSELSGLSVYSEKDGKIKKKLIDVDLLKESTDRWECILRYLALPTTDSTAKEVSPLTRELFQQVGFTKETSRELEISSMGFQFLLLNKMEQIWTYLIYFFKYLEEKLGVDVFPVVEFFLKILLSVTAGESDDESALKSRPLTLIDDWSQEIKTFLQHLRELGLIFIRKKKDGYFFLTPLLRYLAISEGSSTTKETATSSSINDNRFLTTNKSFNTLNSSLSVVKGFLIIETNFRVYAYTNSTLQLAILSTFTELNYRFQDVAMGSMTRDSVRRALQAGITAKQIIQYLKCNAHPKAIESHGQINCIPMTVMDQIYLWEQERKRLTCKEGTLYSTFDSEADFVALHEFARQNNVLEWKCNVQKLVVVGGGQVGHDLVKNWWRSHRQNTVSSY